MDQIAQALNPMRQFAKDSFRLVKRCVKPDRKGRKRKETLCLFPNR